MEREAIDILVVIALGEEAKEFKNATKFSFRPEVGWAVEKGLEQQFEVDRFTFQDRNFVDRVGLVLTAGDTDDSVSPVLPVLLSKFKIAACVNLGISGVVSSDCNVGDIIIANSIDDYPHRGAAEDAQGAEGFEQKMGGRPVLVDLPASISLQRYLAQHVGLAISNTFSSYIEDSKSFLRSFDEQQQNELRAISKIAADDFEPQVHIGPLASGNLVSKSSAFKERLKARNRNLLAVDMESGLIGYLVRTASPKTQYISVRVISDPGNADKAKFEALTKGFFRRRTVGFAAECIANFLQTQNEIVPDDDRALHEPLAQLMSISPSERDWKYTLGRFRRDALDSWDRFYAELLAENASIGVAPVSTLASRLLGSHAKVCVVGEPGTGRTALLLAVHALIKGEGAVALPIFINLGASQLDITKAFDRLTQALSSDPKTRSVVLIVDQYDGARPADRRLYELLLDLEKHFNVSLLLAKQETTEAFADTIEWDLEVRLSSVIVGSNVPSLVRACLNVCDSSISAKLNVEEVVRRIFELGFLRIDYFVLSAFVRNFRKKWCQSARSYAAFLRDLVNQILAESNCSVSYPAVCRSIFWRRFPLEGEQLVRDPDIPSILFEHQALMDVMVAHHALSAVISVKGREITQEQRHVLKQVHSHEVNRVVKLLMASEELQEQAIRGCELIVKSNEFELINHPTYILGRVTGRRRTERAIEALRLALRELKAAKDGYLKGVDVDARRLRLSARSIYISLSYLDDKDAIYEYIDLLLGDEIENDLNRGFHLAYYGDTPATSETEYTLSDKGERWERTRAELIFRIRKTLTDQRSASIINIDIATLVSLAQFRLTQNLSQDQRISPELCREIVGVVDEVLTSPAVLKEELREYLGMMRRRLKHESFNPFQFISELTELKFEERRGWVNNKVGLFAPVETVSSHVLSAVYIAWFLLPDGQCEGEVYNKSKIIETLLFHDIAEAYIGDYAPGENDEGEEEKKIREEIAPLETFPGVRDTRRVLSLWKSFAKRESIEDRIAFDIDKIEAAFQAKHYEAFFEVAEEYEQFMRNHSVALKTKTGAMLWRMLDNFVPRDDLRWLPEAH